MRYILLVFAFFAYNAFSKTTYIPVYRTLIQVIANNDSLIKSSKLMSTELISQDKTVRIYIQHEDITKEKVKAIKRAKMAAGFAEFATITSAASAALSAGSPDYYLRYLDAEYSSLLAEMYHKNAVAEQKLDVYMWIDNVSDQEIMINDLERGLTWYVKPKESMKYKLSNPDVKNLRISNVNPNNMSVKYVNVGVGSFAEKTDIGYEDDKIWVTRSMQNITTSEGQLPMMMFYVTDKKTFETEIINGREYNNSKKKSKNQ